MNILSWKGGFEDYSLILIKVPPDGHCLFHALCLSFFKPYKENANERKSIVEDLRLELSENLDEVYEDLHNGNIKEFSMYVNDYKLPFMKKQLAGSGFIGYGYLEYISNMMNVDIYILSGDEEDIYVSDEKSFDKQRQSVILHYQHHHYDLVGLYENKKITTIFCPRHEFIRMLRKRYRLLV